MSNFYKISSLSLFNNFQKADENRIRLTALRRRGLYDTCSSLELKRRHFISPSCLKIRKRGLNDKCDTVCRGVKVNGLHYTLPPSRDTPWKMFTDSFFFFSPRAHKKTCKNNNKKEFPKKLSMISREEFFILGSGFRAFFFGWQLNRFLFKLISKIV